MKKIKDKEYPYSELWYSVMEALDTSKLTKDAIEKYMELNESLTRKEFVDFVVDDFFRVKRKAMIEDVLFYNEQYL